MNFLRYSVFVAAVARGGGCAYLGRHIATWNYTRLEEFAARLVGIGDGAFRALGDRDDDDASLACFAEGRRLIRALGCISGTKRLEDDASDRWRKEGLDRSGCDARKEA
jgi:hypothetical protein